MAVFSPAALISSALPFSAHHLPASHPFPAFSGKDEIPRSLFRRYLRPAQLFDRRTLRRLNLYIPYAHARVSHVQSGMCLDGDVLEHRVLHWRFRKARGGARVAGIRRLQPSMVVS